MKLCLNSAGERCNCAGVGCPANRYNSSEYQREHKVSTVEIMRSVCVSFRLLFLVGFIYLSVFGKEKSPPSSSSLLRLHLPVSLSLCANESFIWNWLAAFANSFWVQDSEISYWSQACVRTARMKEQGLGAHYYSGERETTFIFSSDAHEVQLF